jgi:hypothetical protein
MSSSLRDAIANVLRGEAVVEILDQQKQSGEPQYVECVEGWTYIVDGTVDFDRLGKYLADRILAIPAIQHGQLLRSLAREREPSISTHSDGK